LAERNKSLAQIKKSSKNYLLAKVDKACVSIANQPSPTIIWTSFLLPGRINMKLKTTIAALAASTMITSGNGNEALSVR
jgi:hypothetical protein